MQNLTKQLDDVGVPVVREDGALPWPSGGAGGGLAASFDGVIDALFGFSFRGPMREPFASVMAALVAELAASDELFPVVSVDVPSGWHVDDGDVHGMGLQPSCLVALTAPKPCTAKLAASADLWLGGRFVPPAVSAAYNINAWIGLYSGTSQIARIPRSVLPDQETPRS